MFEYLMNLYQDKSLTYDQLERAVEKYNQQTSKQQKIKAVNLASGNYVSLQKYRAKCDKLHVLKQELQRKDQAYQEMHMRISILENRLKAYEMMMVNIKEC